MVRYAVKPERAAENQARIEAVFAELRAKQPPGLRYASFKLADGVGFVHVASVETEDGTNPLLTTEAFKEFTSAIKDRCVEPPVTMELEEIGSYRLLE